MTYLSRPVFEFDVDWSKPVNKPFTLDLGELALGFGAEVFAGLRQYTVQGYDVTLLLRTPQEIADFDTFTAALVGRLVGFWFPAVFAGGQIVNVVDTTHFDITAQGLADTWDDNPDQYLIFSKTGQTSVCAKITAVTDLGTGRERITINAAVSWLDTTSRVRRLHYVRLTDDQERGRFLAEGKQERSLKVVELPFEYAAAETGVRPIFLYKFWFADPIGVTWHLTSFAQDVASNGVLFTRSSITHGQRRNTVRGDDSIEISAAMSGNTWEASHPLATFFPVPIAGVLNVQVLETSFADPDTTTAIFTGRVIDVTDGEDGRLSAKCDAWGEILRRKIVRPAIQPECNNYLGDFGCKADLTRHRTSGTIVSVDSSVYPPIVVITLDVPNANRITGGWFAQGWLITGSGVEKELRTILSSTWDSGDEELTLELNLGLVFAVAGQRLDLVAGCDGAAATCKTKFDNFINFGGFVDIPKRNLSLKAMDITQAEGGKK